MGSQIAALLAAVLMPPAEYDVPYDGDLTVYEVTPQLVPRRCREMATALGVEYDGRRPLGCAFWRPGVCVIIMIDRHYRGVWPRQVLRHELGHCNGWPPNHPR